MSSGQERRISKGAVKKTAWTAEEDMQLVNYINRFGIWNWTQMPRFAGLSRSGKSCRLRWVNYLNPSIRRGNYSQEEDEIIISMRQTGAGWSAIAEKLAGRTDNEIKNRWHTHLKKRLQNNRLEEEIVQTEIGTTSNNTDIGSDISSSDIFESYYNQMTDVEPPNFDSFETIEDPLDNFWREQLENDFMEDDHIETNYGQYNPEFLSIPHENCYEEPKNPYNCSDNYDYWFNLLTVSMDIDEKKGVYS